MTTSRVARNAGDNFSAQQEPISRSQGAKNAIQVSSMAQQQTEFSRTPESQRALTRSVTLLNSQSHLEPYLLQVNATFFALVDEGCQDPLKNEEIFDFQQRLESIVIIIEHRKSQIGNG